jgi:predicted AAA+ superfamily ATPase
MKTFKVACLDIGLMQALSGLPLTMQELDKDLLSIYRGSLAEQFIAQELRLTQEEGNLYYWHRFEKSSSAEVDYLVVKDNAVIPVEVKSARSGRLRSLHLMLNEYPQIPYAYVFLDAPFQEPREEKLKYLPLYYLQGAFKDFKTQGP